MKRTELIEVLARVNTCTADNPIAPALSYVQFTGKEAKAFNGVQAISTPFETEFPFIVQGKFLETFLKSLSSTDVELVMNGQYLNVKCGKMKIQVDTLDPEDFLFSKDREIEGTKVYVLSPNFFRGVEECLSFASSEQVKENQNGVYLIETNIFSTDGNRIAKSVNGTTEECNVFLPEKFCSILLKLKKGQKADGVLLVTDNTVTYYDGGIVLTTAISTLDALDFAFFSKYYQKEENYITISNEMRDVLSRATLVLGTEEKKVVNVSVDRTEWTFTADSFSSRYEETITTNVDFFGGLEFSINLTSFINSIKYAETLALFVEDITPFILLKNKEVDFTAIIATV